MSTIYSNADVCVPGTGLIVDVLFHLTLKQACEVGTSIVPKGSSISLRITAKTFTMACKSLLQVPVSSLILLPPISPFACLDIREMGQATAEDPTFRN